MKWPLLRHHTITKLVVQSSTNVEKLRKPPRLRKFDSGKFESLLDFTRAAAAPAGSVHLKLSQSRAMLNSACRRRHCDSCESACPCVQTRAAAMRPCNTARMHVIMLFTHVFLDLLVVQCTFMCAANAQCIASSRAMLCVRGSGAVVYSK